MAEGGFFKRLLAGLTKTRDNFPKTWTIFPGPLPILMMSFMGGTRRDPDHGDIGVTTTENI